MSVVSGRLGRTLSGIAATAAVAATLTLLPTTATAVEADGPHYQEPLVGECRNYTLAQGNKETNSSPAVECGTTHTAKTVAVVQLPETMTWDATVNELDAVVDKKCIPLWRAAVGGTLLKRSTTAFGGPYWYIPTQTQRDHGARWIRCDVVLIGHNELIPLPTNSTPLLPSGAVPYKVTKCLYGASYYLTACSKSHNHRATGAFALANGPYPGDEAIKRAEHRRCASMTTSWSWRYAAPNRTTWKYGARIVVCFSKTTH